VGITTTLLVATPFDACMGRAALAPLCDRALRAQWSARRWPRPIRQVGIIVSVSAPAASTCERMLAVVGPEPSLTGVPAHAVLALLRGEHVHFAYILRMALQDIRLEPGPVCTLRVVGGSGSGQSTLVCSC